MNKSLTPLIVGLAMVVLATVVIVRFEAPDKPIRYEQFESAPTMRLNATEEQIKLKPRQKQAPQSGEQPAQQVSKQETSIPDIAKLLREAEWFLSSGQPNQAEDNLRTILVFVPNNFEALALFGNILYHSGRYAEAEAVFRKQLSLSPDNASVYNNLGSALAKQKKFAEAVSTTEKGLAITADSMPSAFLNLSGMYASIGQSDSAIFYLKKAYDKIGPSIAPLCFDPTLDSIRQHPEFQALMMKIEKNGTVQDQLLPVPPLSAQSETQKNSGIDQDSSVDSPKASQ